ncbi:LysM peptidoglycan-binding domain-containing protein [Fluviispira vulneris]|uniref:LysM peptidoglycan-binding domain-containing protein n=1 Tax=Fluviispira vulneris TaxID=2763012 RepID=UPI001644B47A|nr:LysM peptidoglycan-binding domain-containing protein [Fluviispira vulneris]
MTCAKQNTLRIKHLFNLILILLLSIISCICLSQEKNNTTYKIKEGDTVLSILRKNKLTPIYGKRGYLSEIIKLNPETIHEEGNLIFPNDVIILPIKSLELSIPDNVSYTEYKKSIEHFKIKFNHFKGNDEYVYLIYTVKNGDMISLLLQKLDATPIYGTYGSLNFTIELNPKKRITKGDLIFPREKILLYVPMKIALNLMKKDEKSVLILKEKPKELSKNFFQNSNNFYTYAELEKLYKSRENSKLNLKLKNENQMEFIDNGKSLDNKNSENDALENRKDNTNNLENSNDKESLLDNKKDNASVLENKSNEPTKINYDENAYNNINITNIDIQPIQLTGKIENGIIKLTWDTKNKEYSNMYEIKRSIKSKSSYFTIKKLTTKNNYEDIKLQPGTQYFYTVILHYGKEKKIKSNEISLVVEPKQPHLKATMNNGKVYLSWSTNNIFKGFKYEILRSENELEKFKVIVSNYLKNAYIDKNISLGSKYYYKVKIYYENEINIFSNIVEISSKNLKPILTGKIENNNVKLNWTKNIGNKILKYRVKRSLNKNRDFVTIANNISESNYIDESALNGSTYYYYVEIIDDEIKPTVTNKIKINTLPPIPYNFRAQLDTNNNIHLSWDIDKGNNSIKYRLSRSLSSMQNYEIIQDNLTEKSVTDFNAKKGQRYYYIVSAVDETHISQDSFEITIVSPPDKVTNFHAELIEHKIYLQWDSVKTNIDMHFILKRKSEKDDDFITISEDITTNNYTDLEILPQENYSYMLLAKNEGGISLESNVIKINSFFGKHTANSLGITNGISYYTLKETNQNNGSNDTFYTSASPYAQIEHTQNWTDHLRSHFTLGATYFDMTKSPIYVFSQRQFYLFHANAGVQFDLNDNWKIMYDYSLHEKVLLQTDGYDQANTLIRNFQKFEVLASYTFYKYNTLFAHVEAGPLMTAPVQFSPANLQFGYESALKLTQQNNKFAIEARLFYRLNPVQSENILSKEYEIGLSGKIIFDLGFQ